MGNASYRQTTGNQKITQDMRNYFQNDLPKFTLKTSIGNGKFMKTYLMHVDGIPLVIKVYLKLADEDLRDSIAKLNHILNLLSPAKYPYLLPYQIWIRSSSRIKAPMTPTYLIRQYLNSNLRDRLSTRPFLNEVEKLWLIFQMFHCLKTCHSFDICHGDVKPENIMVTTSNWIILTDFSPFKPVRMRDDDPTDFQYYFDCMGRHNCYVAPERFYNDSTSHKPIFQLNPAMDVFSLGCVVAELFLEGNHTLLDLPAMLKYVTEGVLNEHQSDKQNQVRNDFTRLDHDESPAKNYILRIENKAIRDVVLDMTQRDPLNRKTITEYLEVLKGNKPLSSSSNSLNTDDPEPFPAYFEDFLYPLFMKMHWNGITPDDRVQIISENYHRLMNAITGYPDYRAQDFFQTVLRNTPTPTTVAINAASATGDAAVQNDIIVLPPQKTNLVYGRDSITSKGSKSRRSTITSGDILSFRPSSETPNSKEFLEQQNRSAMRSRRRESLKMARTRKLVISTGSGLQNEDTVATEEKGDDSNVLETYTRNFLVPHENQIELDIANGSEVANTTPFSSPHQIYRKEIVQSDPSDKVAVSQGSNEWKEEHPDKAIVGIGSNAFSINELHSLSTAELIERSKSMIQVTEKRILERKLESGGEKLTPETVSGTKEKNDVIDTRPRVARRHSLTANTKNLFLEEKQKTRKNVESCKAESNNKPDGMEKKSSKVEKSKSYAVFSSMRSNGSELTSNSLPTDFNQYKDYQGTLFNSMTNIQIEMIAAECDSVEDQNLFRTLQNYSNACKESTGSVLDMDSELYQSRDIDRINFQRPTSDGLVLIVGILTSNFRHLKFPQSKMTSLMLLSRIGIRCSDEIILQRIIPTILVAMEDQSAAVRALAIRALRSLLVIVENFTALESNLFPLYIFPALSRVAKDPEIIVRIAFTESISTFAETSKRFLDKTHHWILRNTVSSLVGNSIGLPTEPELSAIPFSNIVVGDESGSQNRGAKSTSLPLDANEAIVKFPYDVKLESLKDQVWRWIRDLIVDNTALSNNVTSTPANGMINDTMKGSWLASYGSMIKRVLLVDIMRLCVFFGQETTSDRLLPQLLTFLSDPDWELRYAFCSKISAVCSFIGPTLTSECVLPIIENAINDVEEKVVVCFIHCLKSLVELSLLSSLLIVEYTKQCKPLLIHPSGAIRFATLNYLQAASINLGPIDSAVFIVPILRDLLRYDLAGTCLTVELLHNALVPPISRGTFRQMLFERVASMQSTQINYMSGAQFSEKAAGGLTSISLHTNIKDGIPEQELYEIELEEKKKMIVMSSYVEYAAKEINSKSLEWRKGYSNSLGGMNTLIVSNPDISTTRAFNGNSNGMSLISNNLGALHQAILSSSYDSLLVDISLTAMPEHSLQSMLVPHQKYGVNLFPSLTEELRSQYDSILQPMDSNLKNRLARSSGKLLNVQDYKKYESSANPGSLSKLRKLYGISGGQADAVRALAVGNGEVLDSSKAYSVTHDVADMKNNTDSSINGSDATTPAQFAGMNNIQPTVLLNATPTTLLTYTQLNSAASPRGIKVGEETVTPRKMRFVQSSYAESVALLKRINALDVPPLPPDLGLLAQPDGKNFSIHVDPLDLSSSYDSSNARSHWRPKENVLLCTLREHSRSVNRIAVSPDQSFFATASSDKTVKIWQTKNLDRVALPRSMATYSQHAGPVVDLCHVENSHSMVSASEHGSLHVWRVDLVNSNVNSSSNQIDMSNYDYVRDQESSTNVNGNNSKLPTHSALSVAGSTQVKTLDLSAEGQVTCVQHYNGDVASVVTYLTQKGGLHAWDLRAAREAFHYKVRPELGFPTCMAMDTTKNWICLGTSTGYVGLWDIRYNVMSKLWRHSSNSTIHKLVCSRSPSKSNGSSSTNQTIGATDGVFLFVSAGYTNETAMWGIPEGGECLKCFRSVPLDASRNQAAPLPVLNGIQLPQHPNAPVYYAVKNFHSSSQTQLNANNVNQYSIQAILTRISHSQVNQSYILTGGSDRSIKFWDFFTPSKCYSVCGLDAAQPKGIFDSPSSKVGENKLFVCYSTTTPSSDKMNQAHLPIRENRGINLPSTNFKDVITDMKTLDVPMKLILSSSKDGELKLWR